MAVGTKALSARSRLLLHLADNGLVMNHRLCEWCAHAPELELEMGLANIGLDHMGHARMWLGLLVDEAGGSEDEWAYLRDEDEYTNLLLVEQPNGDFAMTMAKMSFYGNYYLLLLLELVKQDDEDIKAVAGKALLEAKYHVKFSTHWMKVMVDGNEESIRRVSFAVDYLWQFCGEPFKLMDFERAMLPQSAGGLKRQWLACTLPLLKPLGLELDTALEHYLPLGKDRCHSEHMGYLLTEMQVLARKHHGVKW